MCGRYVTRIEAALEREFALARVRWQPLERFNVAPTQPVPVVRVADGLREGLTMRWGLIPFFAHGVPGAYSTINARVETLRSSPAYRGAWKRGQRCLMLAQGFYEWQQVGRVKQPWYITCADQPTFAFAGLWDSSTPADGPPILSCTLVTLPASPLMAQIHNSKQREPAILRRADQEAWLAGAPDDAFACLQQYPDELRSAWPVSTRVNSPRNEGPELVQPVPALVGTARAGRGVADGGPL